MSKVWSPSQDKAAMNNAVAIADIAYQSMFSVIEERLAGLPENDEKQAIRNSAFQLQQTIDSFIEGQTTGLVEQLETERAKYVLDIRRLHVEVMQLNNRSKALEAQSKVDQENINLHGYNVRRANNAKPSERMGLPHEVEEWKEWVGREEAKMQKLHDVLNTHKSEYAEVDIELKQKVQEFNGAQAKEAELWNRIQVLKKSPEVLKLRIKSEIAKLQEREHLLRQALLTLGAGSIEAVGIGLNE